MAERIEERLAVRFRPGPQPGDGGIAYPAAGAVGDAHERDGVVGVVDHLKVGHRVFDLGALVEARAADHLVRDALADEHVLEHPALRIRPVEDRDLRAGPPFLDQLGDLRGHEPRLRVLVLHLESAHRRAVAEVREERLLLALAVVLDDGVRGAKDGVRGAVVLLERDELRPREVALELEDVADVCSAERENRLVRVPDGAEIPVLREQLEQPVLRVVRVLILVDEDVAERLLPALARFREALEHLDREHEQVVEVHRIRPEQAPLIEPVHVGDGLVVERLDARQVLLGRDELVLRARDLRVDAAGHEALRVALELLQAILRQPYLVGLVVDREVRLVAEPRRFAAENPAARGVEREDPDRARHVAEEVHEPRLHLPRRLVRERDGEDLVRLRALGGDEVGDAPRQRPRLP